MHAPDPEELLETVGLLYESAWNAAAGGEAMDALSRAMRSEAAQIHTFVRTSGEVLHAEATTDESSKIASRLYVAEWGRYDPRPQLLAHKQSGTVVACHHYLDERFVSGNAFYQDYLIPNGLRWALGTVIHLTDGTSTAIGCLRAPDALPFEDTFAAAFSRLLPHFERAAAFRTRLTAAAMHNADLELIVRAMPSACFVVDPIGRVVLTNHAADGALLRLPLSRAGVHIRFTEPQVHAHWSHAIQQALVTGAPHRFIVRDCDAQQWEMQVLPWRVLGRSLDAWEMGLTLVTLERAGGPGSRQLEDFAKRHALTFAEADVLRCLVEGVAPKEIARERGSTLHTVRTQIRSILQKTGTRTQRELVARWQRLP